MISPKTERGCGDEKRPRIEILSEISSCFYAGENLAFSMSFRLLDEDFVFIYLQMDDCMILIGICRLLTYGVTPIHLYI